MQPPLSVGTIIRGQYVVEEVLDNGDSGTVYLVREGQYKHLFVLKQIAQSASKDPYQFAFESLAFKRLAHPALPHIYDMFDDPDYDRTFLLMEYIEGQNLDKARKELPQKHFSLSQVMTFMAPIADAIIYLHSQHPPIIHQDIKPANIIVSNSGNRTVLVNLGITKQGSIPTRDTNAGSGTVGYGAPEQYSSEVDARTDIYALGATFYTLLTGRIPVDVFHRLILLNNKQIDPLLSANKINPSVPMAVALAIHRAMAISMSDRFPSVAQFWQALQADSEVQPFSMLQASAQEYKLSPIKPAVHQIAEPEEDDDPTDPALPRVQKIPGQENIPMPSTTPQVHPSAEPEEDDDPTDPTLPRVPKISERKKPEAAPSQSSVQQTMEPKVAPILTTDPITDPKVRQIPQPPVPPTPSTSPVVSVPKEKTPGLTIPQDQSSMYSLKRARVPFFILLLVTLLIILGVGANFLFYTAGYHKTNSSPSAGRPTAGASHRSQTSTTTHPTAQATPTIYPKLAGIYVGTLHDIPTNTTTNISLTRIQQQQENISGYLSGVPATSLFNGLPQNDPFKGTITTTKQILFVVTSDTGQATFSFDGLILPDGSIGGTYCSLGTGTGKCSGYGVWSVTPAS